MWQVRIHRLVLEQDFKTIPPVDQKTILATIHKKLTASPEEYGKPLTGEFRRYHRLRVGDYRVIYKIVKNEVLVFVIKVGIRRDDKVYQELFARLKKL
ncbi:MAG: type II toxin-antitoxin system RelE/ParE family toxin [Candidatus Omnitrophota bacterium]|nr:type II toxin-antitoxin system RelE/ParE family toxin [Candidatus Omnitrophota bacterium]MDZ4242865.1 type II toxin-antitoxin system RelE/ParE family toxin [Candidatus Omnitrophota bacterium]